MAEALIGKAGEEWDAGVKLTPEGMREAAQRGAGLRYDEDRQELWLTMPEEKARDFEASTGRPVILDEGDVMSEKRHVAAVSATFNESGKLTIKWEVDPANLNESGRKAIEHLLQSLVIDAQQTLGSQFDRVSEVEWFEAPAVQKTEPALPEDTGGLLGDVHAVFHGSDRGCAYGGVGCASRLRLQRLLDKVRK